MKSTAVKTKLLTTILVQVVAMMLLVGCQPQGTDLGSTEQGAEELGDPGAPMDLPSLCGPNADDQHFISHNMEMIRAGEPVLGAYDIAAHYSLLLAVSAGLGLALDPVFTGYTLPTDFYGSSTTAWGICRTVENDPNSARQILQLNLYQAKTGSGTDIAYVLKAASGDSRCETISSGSSVYKWVDPETVEHLMSGMANIQYAWDAAWCDVPAGLIVDSARGIISTTATSIHHYNAGDGSGAGQTTWEIDASSAIDLRFSYTDSYFDTTGVLTSNSSIGLNLDYQFGPGRIKDGFKAWDTSIVKCNGRLGIGCAPEPGVPVLVSQNGVVHDSLIRGYVAEFGPLEGYVKKGLADPSLALAVAAWSAGVKQYMFKDMRGVAEATSEDPERQVADWGADLENFERQAFDLGFEGEERSVYRTVGTESVCEAMKVLFGKQNPEEPWDCR